VWRRFSEVKGGGLLGKVLTLILSDLFADDLDTIGSGPTTVRRLSHSMRFDESTGGRSESDTRRRGAKQSQGKRREQKTNQCAFVIGIMPTTQRYNLLAVSKLEAAYPKL